MNKSDDIKDLAAALCKAQSEMGGAVKDANNPFFKSKYADLGSVIRAIKEPFANNGLSYSQLPITSDAGVGVTTILMHISGQWLSSDLILKPVKNDPQAAGSTLTYARRYALQSIAGIPSEDDDGNAASSKQAVKPTADDIAWINAIKADPEIINQITDSQYKTYLQQFLN
jgi:hypothetical protein